MAPSSTISLSNASSYTVMPVSLREVVRELDLGSIKEGNIVMSGVNMISDSDITTVTNILQKKLSITANVTKCTHLGKP